MNANAAEPKTALIIDFFVPKGTSHILALRELFKKNDFGNLNTPYERLLDKREIDKLNKKMKLILQETQGPKSQRHGGQREQAGRAGRQAGGGGGGDRFKRGRDSYESPFSNAPLHDPFGRSNVVGRGYSFDPYAPIRGGGGGITTGGGYGSASYGRSANDPAIDRLEMLEREIATLRQGMQTNTSGNRSLDDARGLFNDLRPYDRNTLSASASFGTGNGFSSGNTSGGSGRGYYDDLPSLKRLCPDLSRSNPEQSYNDRYGGGSTGFGNGGRKFY